MLAIGNGEVGRHKAHGRSCRLDVNDGRHTGKGGNDDIGIITVAQIGGQRTAACHGMDDKCPVADALGRGQADAGMEVRGGL